MRSPFWCALGKQGVAIGEMEGKGQIVVIEGTIGVGKSTLLCLMEELTARAGLRDRFDFVPETVEPILLANYLSDPARNAGDFQIHKLFERMTNMSKAAYLANRGCIVFVDRGWLGDRAFALAQKDNMGAVEWRRYEEAYASLRRVANAEIRCPVKVIFIDAPVETCMKRISIRDREGEKAAYDDGYVQTIANITRDAVENASDEFETLVLDNGGNAEKTVETLLKWLKIQL